MVLCVCYSLSYVLHLHLLKDAALVGLDGIDRQADDVGDVVHRVSLRGEIKHLALIFVRMISLCSSHLWS